MKDGVPESGDEVVDSRGQKRLVELVKHHDGPRWWLTYKPDGLQPDQDMWQTPTRGPGL